MTHVAEKFERIGSRLVEDDGPSWLFDEGPRLDIIRDRRGREVFTLARPHDCEVEVLDCRPKDRHLLLMLREREGNSRFLCGHDERHYFVASVPDPVSTVEQAKESLKPPEARGARLRRRERGKRRNPAYIRQGEWFFIPDPDFEPEGRPIHGKEPLRRGRGRPHVCEEYCRSGIELAHARGRVTHPDHATVELRGWHRVAPNTEHHAPWAGQVGFAD